jgi:Na+/H+-translocating membrane pyrophosphatase
MLQRASIVQWFMGVSLVTTLVSMYSVYTTAIVRHTDLFTQYEKHAASPTCMDPEMNLQTQLVNGCAQAKEKTSTLNPHVLAIAETLEVLKLCGADGHRCAIVGRAMYEAWWTLFALAAVAVVTGAWCAVSMHRTNTRNRFLSGLPVDQSARYIDSGSTPIGCIGYTEEY